VEEEEKKHHGTSAIWLSFLLNNPIRRRFDKNPEKIITMLGINDTSVVLDFGCGPGFYTIPFASVAKKVVAVDLQEKMLKKAESYAEKNGVKDKIQFVQTDGEEIPSEVLRSSSEICVQILPWNRRIICEAEYSSLLRVLPRSY
jgi:2-polyprenyl-3-methyl-5-hydroxy-6-metoxy-1,4-benzoquinol methylase